MIYLFALALSIGLGKLIYEWYAEINKRNRYMEAQIRLLEQIALKQGVDNATVAKIIKEAKFTSSSDEKLLLAAKY